MWTPHRFVVLCSAGSQNGKGMIVHNVVAVAVVVPFPCYAPSRTVPWFVNVGGFRQISFPSIIDTFDMQPDNPCS